MQGTPGAILFDKLETIIELQRILIGLPPSQQIIAQYPDIGDLYDRKGTSAAQAARTNKALELMLAAVIPSAPENVQTYTVGTTEVLLASNMSTPLMRVDVTNLNVAQPLLVSKKGVVPTAGAIILSRGTKPFVLPIGAELYGIVNLGNILVTVGTGYQFEPVITALLEAEGG